MRKVFALGSRNVSSWLRACPAFILITLLQILQPQEVFSAEKFICILGGTGTRHAIPVLAATFGLYPKYGLDATIVRIGSGTVATAALLGGEADVISTSGPALINARLSGTPVLYVTNFNNWSDAHLLVRPEVTSMEQLRSGKFAVPGLGGGYAHMLRAFFFPSMGLTRAPNSRRSFRREILRPLWLVSLAVNTMRRLPPMKITWPFANADSRLSLYPKMSTSDGIRVLLPWIRKSKSAAAQ